VRIQAGVPLGQLDQRERGQVVGANAGQAAAVAPERGAYRVDQVCLGCHPLSLTLVGPKPAGLRGQIGASMTTRTRWGILATGGSADAFATDLKLLPQANLVAVGSRRLETAQAFAGKHDIPRAYGSWAELAADPEVDVVYVATPHAAHHAAAKLCLLAGKAVLCEKP